MDEGFGALGAHPTLAAALAHKGYETPTPVQAAALTAPDRDLLVSSQTGSGKTVAFGLLLARTLLGEETRLSPAPLPRALVIAPTRELAAQVQRELHWLFGGTGARVIAFTGGTDLRLDAKALKRGVDVVVGTPGRLVDLVERKSLDLSAVQVVVLDEADEMLDLGFREPLELLLERAPKERRTLLFSATLPSGIRALAQRYQKDALPLDPRRGAPQPHEDIRHVAHLCARGERLAALVNVLRLAEDERAIVFCRTRESVAELHKQLAMRGFRATYISGERAQTERTRALEALRQGRVSVLVATNVAARGLDLPDVGMVMHADLPENPEALTHRSGRTGRAGKKGVNVFIVEQPERRRAERLFSGAHLKLVWTAPPSAQAIAAHDRERLRVEVTAAAEKPASEGAVALAAQLLAEHDPAEVVAQLLDRALAERPAGETLTPVALSPAAAPKRPHGHAQAGGGGGGAGGRSAGAGDGMVVFEINLGAKDRAEANWILPLVCRRGAITRREVGAIRVAKDRTYFEIAAGAAGEFAANASEPDPRAPHVQIARSEGADLPSRSEPPRRAPGGHAGPRHAPSGHTPRHAPSHPPRHAPPRAGGHRPPPRKPPKR
ncbi:MAG TPA: DEAD/DEAH box helicase [Kofleriaceae bacterium]|nr:DEAD/DEAH box helicase [Kofleriaceae bacterium]